jgi:xanthine dehydrogenase YagS FAD-binding subunit
MQSFTLERPAGLAAAARAGQAHGAAFIAGGTDLLQLTKNNVESPARVVDLAGLDLRAIAADERELRLGALATMADVAAHPAVRAGWPMIAEALLLAASPQIRNMGTIGGNLLQRTRCGYFRDTGFACNKRAPGSGCPALHGDNREFAVLGTSAHCIATHPSDMPVTLIALDAQVELAAADGARRTMHLAQFYRLPGDTPHIETALRPGEIITEVRVPASAAARRSRYVKLRDRTSFAFARVSAAAAVAVQDGVIRDARLAMGGVGTMPWRMPMVEAALVGRRLSDDALVQAASHAAHGATPTEGRRFKLDLMPRVALRALREATA